ncbi:hypothetical protein D3C78_1636030 [compost metagenome]
MALATSIGSPMRRSGTVRAVPAIICSLRSASRVPSLHTTPGITTLTRMFSAAPSRAAARLKLSTPALAAP